MNISTVDSVPTRRPPVTGRGWRWLLMACWGLVVLPVVAAPASTAWLCWYDDGEAILCQLWATDAAAAAAGAAPLAAEAARGATAPRSDRLPAVARQLWERPAEALGKRVRIPLLSPPEDMGFVRELAEAVMCGGRAACQVRFVESRGALALLLDELEDAS